MSTDQAESLANYHNGVREELTRAGIIKLLIGKDQINSTVECDVRRVSKVRTKYGANSTPDYDINVTLTDRSSGLTTLTLVGNKLVDRTKMERKKDYDGKLITQEKIAAVLTTEQVAVIKKLAGL